MSQLQPAPSRSISPRSTSLREAVEKWLNSYSNENTRRAYRHRIQDYLDHSEGLTIESLQDYSQSVRERINSGTISPNTGRAYLFALTCFLKWGHVFDLWPELTPDKISHLVDIPSSNSEVKPKDIMSREETNQLLEATESQRDRAIITLLAGSGLRVSELVELTPDSFYQTEDNNGKKYYVEVRNSKGNKSRSVLIARAVYQSIAEYLLEQGRNINQGDDEPIFQGREGPISSKTVNRTIKSLSESVDLGRSITAHNLRHTYATRKLIQGLSLRTISKRLGHESLDTTEEYYIELIGQLKETPEDCWFQDSCKDERP